MILTTRNSSPCLLTTLEKTIEMVAGQCRAPLIPNLKVGENEMD
jgi:hypothetical protein